MTQTVSLGSITITGADGNFAKISLRLIEGNASHVELVIEGVVNGTARARAVGVLVQETGLATIQVHHGPGFHEALVVDDSGANLFPAA